MARVWSRVLTGTCTSSSNSYPLVRVAGLPWCDQSPVTLATTSTWVSTLVFADHLLHNINHTTPHLDDEDVWHQISTKNKTRTTYLVVCVTVLSLFLSHPMSLSSSSVISCLIICIMVWLLSWTFIFLCLLCLWTSMLFCSILYDSGSYLVILCMDL